MRRRLNGAQRKELLRLAEPRATASWSETIAVLDRYGLVRQATPTITASGAFNIWIITEHGRRRAEALDRSRRRALLAQLIADTELGLERWRSWGRDAAPLTELERAHRDIMIRQLKSNRENLRGALRDISRPVRVKVGKEVS